MPTYVTMTDKYLSDFGEAKGKVRRLIIECDTEEQVQEVVDNAKARGDMIRIKVNRSKIHKKKEVSYLHLKYEDLPPTWKRGLAKLEVKLTKKG